MLRLLTIFIALMSCVVSAKDFPADYMDMFKSKSIDLSQTEWIVSYPAPNRIFLVHQRSRSVALITEHMSSVPVEQMEEYFAGHFTTDALKSREKFLRNEEGILDLDGGSNTHRGVRYGGIGFKVAMDEGIGKFHERMWSENGKLWHLSLVSFEGSHDSSVHADLNFLMEKISFSPVKTTSVFDWIIPEAYAGDARCNINESGSWNQLAGIVPKVKQQSRCNNVNINPKNRGNGYGIKLNMSSLKGCVQGPPAAWNAMKQGFLSGLNSLANATQQKMKQYGCEKLRPPQAKGVWESIKNSFAMQAYTNCLQAAATGALVSQAFQAIKSTLSGIRDLYNWVKAGNNPWSAAIAIVSKEVNGFLCLNAAAQAKVVCEYATHFFVAMGVVVATAATGGALAPVAGAGAAARVSLAMSRGVTAARAFIATPYTTTRTIVKAPGAVVRRVVATAKDKKPAAIVVSSSSPGSSRTRATAASGNTRRPASVNPAAATPPVRAVARPKPKASVTAEEVEGTAELNRKSLQDTRKILLEASLKAKDLNLHEAAGRIREIGVENYFGEHSDKFSSSERERLTALYKQVYPEVEDVVTPKAPVVVAKAEPEADRVSALQESSLLTPDARTAAATELLGRDLSDAQKTAILEAHDIGSDSGNGFFTYTQDQINAKALKLRAAGFTAPEIRTLMERGITGKFSEVIQGGVNAGQRADDLGKVILLRSTRESTPVDLSEYNQTRKEAAQYYQAAGKDSPLFMNESARQYILAGDASSAAIVLTQAINGGMDPKKVIQGYREDLRRRELLLKDNPNDLVLRQEVLARHKVVGELEIRFKPKVANIIQAPKEVRAPASPPQAQQSSQHSAQEISRAEALNRGNALRLKGDHEEASKYLVKAATAKTFEDRNYYTAFNESMKGKGTVAKEMFGEVRAKGYTEINKFILELYEKDLYQSPDQNYRANVNKLLKEIQAMPAAERGLFTPQENMMRSMLSATSY